MMYVHVTGKSETKDDYSTTYMTNLELALDIRADLVYGAKALGYDNVRSWFLDEDNGKGWESMDDNKEGE